MKGGLVMQNDKTESANLFTGIVGCLVQVLAVWSVAGGGGG